ncbi:hypothetical protein ZIOFF_015090 [Zingiber officinale]|uniref:KIB1-4 beta-propeller domain-containing protein n=1 Tax=Zingiber officinale TaxID=94328 RepID=A0A8J5HXY9_ZINOF|nr:hypothetical protein ZIOFF_015090 [Zingiber officinale]
MSSCNMDGVFGNPQGNCEACDMSSLPSRDLPVHIVELILNQLSWSKPLSLRSVGRIWKAAVQNYNPMRTQSPCHLRGETLFCRRAFLFVLDSILGANSISALSLVNSWSFMDEGELSMHLIKRGTVILVLLASSEGNNGPINDFSVFQLQQDTSMVNMKNRIYQMLLPRVSFVEVESLRNHAIFLGNIQSICLLVENTGCKENCIYFNQPGDEIAWPVFDLGSKSITDGPVLSSKAVFRSLFW